MNKKLVTGDTVYLLLEDDQQFYKIVSNKIECVSSTGLFYILDNGVAYYPPELYYSKKGAAKAALLLTSERLKDLQEQITKLERRAKQAERALKDFAAIVTPPDGDS